MGCGGSKVDDLALVVRCKKRKELIMAAADHRYAFAAAHISYFKSLESVGDALQQFVEEELVIPSPPSSPVLTLPSDEVKPKKRHSNASSGGSNHESSQSPSSLSHAGSGSTSHIHSAGDHNHDHDHDGSHLHLSDSDSELSSPSVHVPHHNRQPEQSTPPFSGAFPQTGWWPYGMKLQSGFPPSDINPNAIPSWEPFGMNTYPPPQPGWDPYSYGMNSTYHTYYMKKSAPAVQTVIHDPDNSHQSVQVPESSYMYPTSYSSYPYQNGGNFFGFPTGAPSHPGPYGNKPPSPLPEPPPPPSPKVSSWDFLNPFDTYEHGYPGYYSQYSKYELGSNVSSPEINEVREREGIPDLEDETDPEVLNEAILKRGKKVYEDVKKRSGEGTSRSVQSRKTSESSSKSMPSYKQSSNNGESSSHGFPVQSSDGISVEPSSLHSESTHSTNLKEGKSSPESTLSKSSEDTSTKKKGVTFVVGEGGNMQDDETSMFNTFTAVYTHGTRDLNDVVEEIKNEFKTASAIGKEMASMLEVGKLCYQPKFSLLKVILSRVIYLIPPTLSYSSTPPSKQSVSTKLADSGNTKTIKLSSTLDKLYAWEKKLYKEVKDEERLRLIYEKQCRKLKLLDDQGAENSKIEATQASIQKLLTKIDVCIKAVKAISRRIQKLRDEELQPQVTQLVHGLIRMWRGVLKCHQKQFQAIMNSKLKKIRTNTMRRDSSLTATMELEVELRTWCNHFRDWINNQRSFIESLNAWLLRCLDYEPEESSDGIVPFSPGRLGAPPIFVICNDWFEAMETISEKGVAEAVDKFASILQQLWSVDENEEKREERLKAAYISMSLRLDKKKSKSDLHRQSGISHLDDLKVDLDSMRKTLQEERANQKKETGNSVNRGSSSSSKISLQANLVPIFEALGNFTSEALKAFENVRTPKV